MVKHGYLFQANVQLPRPAFFSLSLTAGSVLLIVHSEFSNPAFKSRLFLLLPCVVLHSLGFHEWHWLIVFTFSNAEFPAWARLNLLFEFLL